MQIEICIPNINIILNPTCKEEMKIYITTFGIECMLKIRAFNSCERYSFDIGIARRRRPRRL